MDESDLDHTTASFAMDAFFSDEDPLVRSNGICTMHSMEAMRNVTNLSRPPSSEGSSKERLEIAADQVDVPGLLQTDNSGPGNQIDSIFGKLLVWRCVVASIDTNNT